MSSVAPNTPVASDEDFVSFPTLPDPENENAQTFSKILSKTLRKVTNNASNLVHTYSSPKQTNFDRLSLDGIDDSANGIETEVVDVEDVVSPSVSRKSTPRPPEPVADDRSSIATRKADDQPRVTSDSNSLRLLKPPQLPLKRTTTSSVVNVNALANTSDPDKKKPDLTEASKDVHKSLQNKISSIFNNLPNDIELSDDSASDAETVQNISITHLPSHQSITLTNPNEINLYSEATSTPSPIKVERGRTSTLGLATSSPTILSFHALRNKDGLVTSHRMHKKPSSNLSAVLIGNAKSIINNNITGAVVSSASSMVSSKARRKKKKPKTTSGNPLKSGGIPRKYWMNDAFVADCLNCFRPFSAFRRKHHCRFCGQIFCSDCTLFISYSQHKEERRQNKTGVKQPEKFYSDKLRVCKPCYDDVIVYLSDESTSSELDVDNAIDDSFDESPDHLSRMRSYSNTLRRDSLSGRSFLHKDSHLSLTEMSPVSDSHGSINFPLGHKHAPQMAIPTTRKGESVEIPVSKSSYTLNLTMLAPNHNIDSADYFSPGIGSKWLKNHPSSFELTRSSSLENFSQYLLGKKGNRFSRIQSSSEDNFKVYGLSETENEADESENEDEQAMSLYTSLNNPERPPLTSNSTSVVPTLSEFPTMSSIEKRFPRGLSTKSGISFLEDRPTSFNKSSERAHASLMRMQSRRKSKLVRNFLNHSYNGRYFDPPFPVTTPELPSELSKSLNIEPPRFLTEGTPQLESSLSDAMVEVTTTERAYEQVLEKLLNQSLEDCDIYDHKDEWKAALNKVLASINHLIITDTLDIKQYIKIKKNLGGRIDETSVIEGLFMTKNIDSRKMAARIENPRIAMLMFPLEYLKQKEQFISLRIVHSQQEVYITNLVSRLISLEPDVVVVGDTVCGIAEKLLEDANITVISNVKPQVVERISRYTKADIFQTVNDLFFKKGSLGRCKLFEVKKYLYKDLVKTFVYFTGSDIENGFTICLRGGDEDTLNSIKYAAETMISAVINARFERRLLDDHGLAFRVTDKSDAVDLYNKVQELNDFDEEDDRLEGCKQSFSTHEIENYIKLFTERKLSTSPGVLFPLPGPLINVVDAYETLREFYNVNKTIQSAESMDEIELDKVEQLRLNVVDFDQLPNGKLDLLKMIRFASDARLTSLVQDFQSRIRVWASCMKFSSYQLYPVFHKRIHFLHSTVSIRHSTPCTGPSIVAVDYYTDNDKCLGWYLNQLFRDAGNVCEECNELLINHYKSYVHGNSQIDLLIEKHSNLAHDQTKNKRVMWSTCKECAYSTPIVELSDEASSLSLGKFFELCFLGKDILLNERPCQHDFFKSHVRYFSFNELVIRMEFSNIDSYEVVVPRKKLEFSPDVDIKLKIDTMKTILSKTNAFFQSISKRLNRVKVDTFDKAEDGIKRVEELKAKLDEQTTVINEKTLQLYESTLPTVHLPLNVILRDLQELGVEWDNHFNDFEKNFLPSENEITRITQFHLRTFLMDNYADQPKEVEMADMLKEQKDKAEPSSLDEQDKGAIPASTLQKESTVVDKIQRMEELLKTEGPKPDSFSRTEGPILQHLKHSHKIGQRQPLKVQDLAKYYNEMNLTQLSKEFKERRERELSEKRSHVVKAYPIAASKPIVEIYNKIEDVVDVDDDKRNEKRREARRREAVADTEVEEAVNDAQDEKAEPKADGKPAREDDDKVSIPQPERNSLLKSLTNFWADRSATLWDPLEYPLSLIEHTFADSDVIVREDEPSSLVAFCLSSSDYIQKLKVMADKNDEESVNEVDDMTEQLNSKKMVSFTKIEKKFKKTQSNSVPNELEAVMNKQRSNHLKYQYIDGNTLLSCKIFYSEQFEAFRKSCGASDNFIQSLSRCVKWNSSGGKSGSNFLKTLDNRYIVKELSKSELESFVSIAPFYFKYISQSTFNTLTTAIAKIFGFYQVHIKNTITGKTFRMDFLIMENLFYNRKTTRIFDLKGSMRNRHVQQTGKENEVLLDENMIEYIYESPVFVKEQLKKLLRGCLFNDTSFLSAMDVMDYSLVVGIDDQLKKLHIGIIDWLRTFTWDKKVENWVKGNSLVGKKGKDPTIVTPKQYRTRFREAMERYILEVPDVWYEGAT